MSPSDQPYQRKTWRTKEIRSKERFGKHLNFKVELKVEVRNDVALWRLLGNQAQVRNPSWYHWCSTILVQIIKSEPQISWFTRMVPPMALALAMLFIIYILPLGPIIQKYGLNFYCYAGDTEIYIHTKLAHALSLSNLVCCLNKDKSYSHFHP